MNRAPTQTTRHSFHPFLSFISHPFSAITLCTQSLSPTFAFCTINRKNAFYLAHFLSLHPLTLVGAEFFLLFFGLFSCCHRRQREKQKIMFRQPMKNSVSVRVFGKWKENSFHVAVSCGDRCLATMLRED